MDKLTWIAQKQLHPKKQCIGWRVKQGQQTLFESKEYGLCMHYITVHGLKLTPQQIF